MVKLIRKPIITVLGHVDSGKTKLLDAIRGTAIAEKEAGGITQHIGATEVPIDLIKKLSGNLIEKYKFKITIPGLLFIDTPGHEAFTNLRRRGGSIADLAVLVVDVMKGLQPQTIEAIDILKTYKTPFIVGANKIDTIRGYETRQGPFSANIKNQQDDIKEELDKKIYSIVAQLHSKGFQSERFDRCNDFTKEIPIIPICAKSSEGVPEILMFLAGLSQKYLEERLEIEVKGPGKGTILEVREERGLGTTIDVILYEGSMDVGQGIVVGGRTELIKTKIRALLEPKPLDEIRTTREKFKHIPSVHAASGVKIAAPNLDEALAGSPVRIIISEEDEKEVLEEIQRVKILSDAIGPIIRADTLGSLEALVKLLENEGLKIKKADVGDVSRRDIMMLEPVKEKDMYKAVVFAFNTKVSAEAKEEAGKKGIKILEGNVVYRLIEEYNKWVDEEREKEKAQKLGKLTMPVKFKLLPGYVFRHSKPAIIGVKVLEGRLKSGIDVMKDDGKIIGKVHAIQASGQNVEEAKKGEEVAVSISGAKAIVGRNLFEKDELYSFIPEKQFEELDKLKDVLNEDEIELIKKIKQMKTEVATAQEERK